MVDHLSIPQSTKIDEIHQNDSTRKRPMIKTYSFTTDEDDQFNKQITSNKSKEKLPSFQKKFSSNQKKTNLNEKFSLKFIILFLFFCLTMSMLFIYHDRWISRLIRSRHSSKSLVGIDSIESSETNEKIVQIDQQNAEKQKKNSIKISDESTIKMKNSTENRRKKIDEQSIVVRQSNLIEKKSSYRTISHRTKHFNATKIRPNVILFKSEDFIEDLRKELKIRCEDRQIFTQIMKITGLNKDQLNKFIYQKNYQILHLQSFLSLLDYFHLMILILPK